MPKIQFRGKTYNNEFEMPYDVRQAYDRDEERRAGKSKAGIKSLTDIVDIPEEVKEIYERAIGKVEENFDPPRDSRDLPKTEDLYRRSAPADMRNLPSDESIYRPSRQVIDPAKSAIEPESGLRRLVSSIFLALMIVAIVFIAMQFMP